MNLTARLAPARLVALAQGLYYLASGIWPLLSLRTFERVTGPKVDDWLAKTVGALAAVVGGVLVVRSVAREAPPDPLLGAAAAAAFAAVDVNYVARRRISPIYLADAVAEVALIAGWAATRARARE